MTELAFEALVIYAVLGVFVGFAAGLFGIGGGMLMVPLLSFVFQWQGLPTDQVMHLALGTSMAAIIATSVSSLRAHHSHGAVLWPIVKRLAPGIVLGTLITTYIATRSTPQFLSVFFAIFVSAVAVQMFFNVQSKPSRELPSNPVLLGVGTIIGAVSALVSIGGGALTVPFLSWCNTPIRKAIGTSAAVGLPISVAGTCGYILYGQSVIIDASYTVGVVYLPAAIMVSLMSVAMAPVGARLTHKLPITTIKKVFSALLVLLAIKVVWTSLA